jgi:hypothetical protein
MQNVNRYLELSLQVAADRLAREFAERRTMAARAEPTASEPRNLSQAA